VSVLVNTVVVDGTCTVDEETVIACLVDVAV
jgi:hypothetical protein